MTDRTGPPAYWVNSFICPWCGVAAAQSWESPVVVNDSGHRIGTNLDISTCYVCRQDAIWYARKMIVPRSTTAPLPHPDLPEELQIDYLEARDIAIRSPRGAATLLRLVVQKLLPLVGAQGRSIDDQIGYLAARGLHQEVVHMLDIVRVTGNDAVHPSELILEDDPDIVDGLFWAVNEITEQTLGHQKRIASGTARFSERVRAAIADRTAKAAKKYAAESATKQAIQADGN